MGCIGVNPTAKTTPKIKINAMLAELEGVLPERSYSAAVAATIASAIDILRHEPISILRLPTTSWRRASSIIVSERSYRLFEFYIPPIVAATHPESA